MVLIVVLWTLLMLAYLAASFASTTRTEARLARNTVDAAQAEAMADGAVYLTIGQLLTEGGHSKLLERGSTRAWPIAGGVVVVSVENEAGKVALNGADAELLTALFTVLDIDKATARSLADRIIDFRDADDDRRPNGAERPDYQRSKGTPGPKNRPFELVEELQRVLGMNAALYRRIAPYVTAAIGTPRPDQRYASAPVVQAMEMADAARASRRATAAGTGRGAVADPDIEAGQEVFDDQPLADATVTLHAEARTADGAVFVREAIIQFTEDPDQPFTITDWRRGKRSLP